MTNFRAGALYMPTCAEVGCRTRMRSATRAIVPGTIALVALLTCGLGLSSPRNTRSLRQFRHTRRNTIAQLQTGYRAGTALGANGGGLSAARGGDSDTAHE